MPSREGKKGRFVRFCAESPLVLGIIRRYGKYPKRPVFGRLDNGEH